MATKLDDEDYAGIALFLLARREEGRLISDVAALPPVSHIEEVYSIHSKMTETQSSLGAHVGWKCGACNDAGLKTFGLAEPFRAPLFQNRIYTGLSTVFLPLSSSSSSSSSSLLACLN